jgi:hypothetical protein
MPRVVRLISAWWLLARAALGQTPPTAPRVSLIDPGPADRAVAERLSSELRSEVYAVEWSEGADFPCDSPSSAPSSERDERAWVRVDSELPGAPADRSFVCYRSATGRLLGSSARSSNGDPATLAISTVEVLNGLRSSSRVPPSPREPVESQISPADGAASSLFAGGTFAFSPLGLPPLLGANVALRSGIDGPFSLVFDTFVTLRSAEIERPDRRIDVRAAWLRIGPRLSWPASSLDVDGSLLAGPAFVWTTADAERPLIGSADGAGAFILSLALGAEIPRRSPVFLRVSVSGSVLVPRVSIETGRDAVRAWAFVETSLGLGLRWSDAGAPH